MNDWSYFPNDDGLYKDIFRNYKPLKLKIFEGDFGKNQRQRRKNARRRFAAGCKKVFA